MLASAFEARDLAITFEIRDLVILLRSDFFGDMTNLCVVLFSIFN